MHRRLSAFIACLVALLVVVSAAAQTLAAPQCFSVPGITNCIDGRFASFWNGNGGLPVFGYPITPQRDEVNADMQQTYQTQWFERNRFEQHPENAAPYDVLLGRLGDELLKAQGRDWHNEPNNGNPLGGTCQHFDLTNRDVCGPFLTYWQAHRLSDPKLSAYDQSLQLFGLPLTGVKSEKNPNGDTVLTQWFERARFELHPEVGNIVLLGLLGHERLGSVMPPANPGPTSSPPSPTPIPTTSPPVPTLVPTNPPPPVTAHTFYLSTYPGAYLYYCDDDPAWQSLSPTYLKHYNTEAELLHDYPGRVLRRPCGS
ncbi:MAG: hypothetical protein H0X37_02770 [Herpetosiphonaceae bacterium]|nr:hypothetical protein [Herpetosiphonaceae bacterium]